MKNQTSTFKHKLTTGGRTFSWLTKFLYFAMFREGSIRSCRPCYYHKT